MILLLKIVLTIEDFCIPLTDMYKSDIYGK